MAEIKNIKKKKTIDIDTTSSNLTGYKGLFEKTLRKFRITTYLVALLPIYVLAAVIMGISATPGVYFFNYIYDLTAGWLQLFHYAAVGFGMVCGFFLYGFTLIFVTPAFNFILPLKLKPFRGIYYSLQSVPWFIHNALVYLVRYTFLEFITPTPLNILFYKMMGMKIGKGVHINTTNISDVCMIELEDKVTIGGSAHIICHYAAKGYLVVAPVKIKKGATLGLKSTIMGDVEIGEGALIAPHQVVYPKTKIPAGYRPFNNNKENNNNQ